MTQTENLLQNQTILPSVANAFLTVVVPDYFSYGFSPLRIVYVNPLRLGKTDIVGWEMSSLIRSTVVFLFLPCLSISCVACHFKYHYHYLGNILWLCSTHLTPKGGQCLDQSAILTQTLSPLSSQSFPTCVWPPIFPHPFNFPITMSPQVSISPVRQIWCDSCSLP